MRNVFSACKILDLFIQRLTNPTVSVLEERLASIEQSRAAVACSSGHAAQQLAFIPLLKNGDHFISSK